MPAARLFSRVWWIVIRTWSGPVRARRNSSSDSGDGLIRKSLPLELVPTFLGAHAVPPEFRHDQAGYVDLLVRQMLPVIARQKLAEFCDVFCEAGVFSLAEAERILKTARDLGFRLKVHADELTPLGGAQLAARLGAASADHLLCISEAGIDALAGYETVATLLPGTAFFLGMV